MTKPLLFSLLILCLSSCKKHSIQLDNSYGLPNSTQIGSSLLACRINDKNWISKTSNSTFGASIRNDTFYISGSGDFNNSYASIYLMIGADLKQDSTYQIIPNVNSVTYTTTRLCPNMISNINYASAVTGTITLTKLDRTKRIISGLFDVSIPIQGCDTLRLTLGRFDATYKQ